ncbi:hypothetical protein IQ06DRAFT_297884 [Phaeosphaeriaceae sp. SRC1lsM3a]|nr:hypothetical protein IQ06DRAFT_297884 [Stagonospora sp. SRC1lsM3a]
MSAPNSRVSIPSASFTLIATSATCRTNPGTFKHGLPSRLYTSSRLTSPSDHWVLTGRSRIHK